MKAKLLVLSCALALTACDKWDNRHWIRSKSESCSREMAQQAYQAFTQGIFRSSILILSQSYSVNLKLMKKDMRKFAKSIPKQAITTQKLYRNTLKIDEKKTKFVCSYL